MLSGALLWDPQGASAEHTAEMPCGFQPLIGRTVGVHLRLCLHLCRACIASDLLCPPPQELRAAAGPRWGACIRAVASSPSGASLPLHVQRFLAECAEPARVQNAPLLFSHHSFLSANFYPCRLWISTCRFNSDPSPRELADFLFSNAESCRDGSGDHSLVAALVQWAEPRGLLAVVRRALSSGGFSERVATAAAAAAATAAAAARTAGEASTSGRVQFAAEEPGAVRTGGGGDEGGEAMNTELELQQRAEGGLRALGAAAAPSAPVSAVEVAAAAAAVVTVLVRLRPETAEEVEALRNDLVAEAVDLR